MLWLRHLAQPVTMVLEPVGQPMNEGNYGHRFSKRCRTVAYAYFERAKSRAGPEIPP
jgi:hypothetical protein